MRRVLLHACLISSLASVGQLASAQVTYAIQPLVGYYQPLGHFDPAAFYSTDLPRTPSDLAGLLWGWQCAGDIRWPARNRRSCVDRGEHHLSLIHI